MSCTVLVKKAAITSYMNYCHNAPLGFPKLQDHKSLMLHGRSFLGRGRERVAIVFASQGGQYLIHGFVEPIAT